LEGTIFYPGGVLDAEAIRPMDRDIRGSDNGDRIAVLGTTALLVNRGTPIVHQVDGIENGCRKTGEGEST